MITGNNLAAQDVWAQELVFLGNLYNNPTIFSNYAHVLLSHNLFKTQPNKTIWEKTAKYYMKYGLIPSDPLILTQVFDAKELEVLQGGRDVAADDSGNTQFLLDTFDETIKLTMLKQMRATLDLSLSDGIGDVSKSLDVIGSTLNNISLVTTSKLGLGASVDLDILNKWAHGELPTQQPLVPIPIPGIEEYISGVPRGEVNYVIAPYGRGKTTVLCCIAAGMLDTSDVLYVSLEMPAANLLFKILGARTTGKVDSNLSFYSIHDEKTASKFNVDSTLDVLEEYAKTPFRMYFLDVPARSIKASNIAIEVQRLRLQGAKIDSVIIDYGDLLQSEQGGMADMGWQYMAAVSEELAAMAKREGVTVWTASQTGKGLGSDSDNLRTFRPLRGKDLWGSDGKMHTGCIALGMSVHRSARFPRYGVGALSTLKNRYALGGFFGDLVMKIDYATSQMQVVGAVKDVDADGELWADVLQPLIDDIEQQELIKTTGNKKRTSQYAQRSKAVDVQKEIMESLHKGYSDEGDDF